MFDDTYDNEYADPTEYVDPAEYEAPTEEGPTMPQMVPVDSSNVEEFGYDDANQTLYVRFLGKGSSPSSLYVYYSVPYETYNAFFEAPSKGKFIWTSIRDIYSYDKLE